MKPILILFMTCIVFSCCKKEDDKPYVPIQLCTDISRDMDTINKYIHGTWEWLEEKRQSQITGDYEYLTPTTEGYTLILKLAKDTAQFLKNNKPDSTYRFEVMQEKDITGWPDDSLPVIAFYRFSTGIRQSYVPIKICKHQLLMQHQFVTSLGGQRVWKRL